jgi:HEAT repeat protein
MRELEAIPTGELLARVAMAAERDPTHEAADRWALVCELHRRGESSVFRAAATWCASQHALLRCLGADVLGQLGFEARLPFASESQPILTSLLSDPDTAVISCALVALGHLDVGDPQAICSLASHASEDVRYSVAFCLGKRDDDLSRQTLVALTSDPDVDVRNWATFGLGSLSEFDSPAVREALASRLSDPDCEVRREAMCGLAARGDARAVAAILNELQQDNVSALAIEAAAELPDDAFLPALEALLEASPNDAEIMHAIERCRQR